VFDISGAIDVVSDRLTDTTIPFLLDIKGLECSSDM
jgi:hypothetical protein